jgi:hypothetical protein
MTAAFVIEGIPGALKALDELAPKDRSNTMRRAVRAALKPMQQQLKFEGDTPGHPYSFTKVPAAKISTHGGGWSGGAVEGYVRPKSPLFNIFEPGAKAHEISPGKVHREHAVRGGRQNKGQYSGPGKVIGGRSTALAGPAGGSAWTNTGRKRAAAFFSTKPVRHPGMKARPILAVAFNAALGAAEDAVANAIFGTSTGPVVGA